MAGGNKKKKKTANTARGFATTSIQSKSKVDTPQEPDSLESSGLATPDNNNNHIPNTVPEQAPTSMPDNDLQKLSPEELEAQLETSELQQFVEAHASKVKKEAARQASKLQTEKRLLRGQADFLSTRNWLPEELMQQLFDLVSADLDHDQGSRKQDVLPRGDEAVSRIWALRLILLDLGIAPPRVQEAIQALLHTPPAEISSANVWGLSEALDWLALECDPSEPWEYDTATAKVRVLDSEDESSGTPAVQSEEETSSVPRKRDSPLSDTQIISNSAAQETVDVSDIDSDLEPDELLSVYLRTKARLIEVAPAPTRTKKGTSDPRTSTAPGPKPKRVEESKLNEKLQKIQSDPLFDQREADTQWNLQKAQIAKEVAQRKKLDLTNEHDSEAESSTNLPVHLNGQSADVLAQASELGAQMLEAPDDDDLLLGGMFDSLPGVQSTTAGQTGPSGSHAVTVRDFGRITGNMTARRVLEEACRSRDSRCKISYRQISPTTYSCRHSVTIQWTKEQDIANASYMQHLSVKTLHRQLSVAMITEAAPEVLQSESYVATAALFLIFSGSPKEEKAHLKLPPAFRDLWDEFVILKRDYIDATDRDTVRELRALVEKNAQLDDDSENEVVFNASSRRLIGSTNGTSTPASRPHTPGLEHRESSQQPLMDLWSRKTMTPAYQRMLTTRMNLPMYHAKSEVLEAIQRNQITIVQGDTGSGKSTQLPQFILEHELSNGRPCKIYCTQPRRISAISLAHRVSEELGEHKNDLGTSRSLVGYAIRLESHAVASTKVIYATVGIVLRMLESENGLREITHLVLDEVHERNIDTDFLLIVVRAMLKQRPDLKVVLMSATVDAQKFSRYLDNAPIIQVPGRTFPVTPLFLEDAIELTGHVVDSAHDKGDGEADEVDAEDRDQPGSTQALKGYSAATRNTLQNYDEYRIDYELIIKLLEKIAFDSQYIDFSKAILLFVPGIQEIRQLNDMLLGHRAFAQGWRIHALHSTFSSEDQQAAFEIPPHGTRKIVIATNIAETGITIPDVTCVIDTGKHREMRFDERRQMSRLIQSFIAKANAKQRRGRAGRVQEGICFHLFTKHRFENLMAEQQMPEILRLSLQDLVMRVKICKLGNIEEALSEALDPPSSKNIRRAIDALIEVGALTSSEQLTTLGSQLAKLPLDAQLGKLILYGVIFGCLNFALTIAAALSSKSPFLSPMYARKQADTVRMGFKRGDSDLITLYNAYSSWRKACTTPGLSEYHFCNKNFLSPQNLANIEDLKAQLLTSLIDAGVVHLDPSERTALTKIRPGSRQRNFVTLPPRYSTAEANEHVISSVVAWSFYPKIVKREGKGWRNIANNQSLALHPTSVNKLGLPHDVQYLSFYSIMQGSSRFTNAQETTGVADFALVLLAGEAVFHIYAGVIVIDGNRMKFKVRDWRTMIALKILRGKVREALARQFKYAGRELGARQKRWMELVGRMFEVRNGEKVLLGS